MSSCAFWRRGRGSSAPILPVNLQSLRDWSPSPPADAEISETNIQEKQGLELPFAGWGWRGKAERRLSRASGSSPSRGFRKVLWETACTAQCRTLPASQYCAFQITDRPRSRAAASEMRWEPITPLAETHKDWTSFICHDVWVATREVTMELDHRRASERQGSRWSVCSVVPCREKETVVSSSMCVRWHILVFLSAVNCR